MGSVGRRWIGSSQKFQNVQQHEEPVLATPVVDPRMQLSSGVGARNKRGLGWSR